MEHWTSTGIVSKVTSDIFLVAITSYGLTELSSCEYSKMKSVRS